MKILDFTRVVYVELGLILLNVASLLWQEYAEPQGSTCTFTSSRYFVNLSKEAALADFSDLNNRIKYAVILAVVGLSCLAFVSSTLVLLAVLMVVFSVEVIGALWKAVNREIDTGSVLVTLLFLNIGIGGFVTAALVRSTEHGLYDLLLVVLGVVATDIFAYVGGKKYGRTKFAPRISPNKTREGVIIGVFMGMLVLVSAWTVLNATSNTSITQFSTFVVLAVVLPIVAVYGDLLESKSKRLIGVKDFGTLLGDHGGVADRFDAMSAAFLAYGLLTFALA